MGYNSLPLPLRQIKAAKLVAESESGNLTGIAAQIGVAAITLRKWARTPRFKAIVAAYRKQMTEELLNIGIAQKAIRIKKIQRFTDKIEAIAAARGQDIEMSAVPGGTTGLIARDRKGIGSGDAAEVVDVYKFDEPMVKQYLNSLEQVAKEIGGAYERDVDGVRGPGTGVTVNIAFPTLTKEDQDAFEIAKSIDLPPMARRLIERPSDGKPL